MASTDRDALLAVYRSVRGVKWKHSAAWGTNADLKHWYGVGVNDQGRVAKLSLNNNNLRGPFPLELGNLTALEYLDLGSNRLSGPISERLGALTKLETLQLSFNEFFATIPRELGNLASLQYLDLRGNKLSGPIPGEFGNLRALTILALSGNQLTGELKQLCVIRFIPWWTELAAKQIFSDFFLRYILCSSGQIPTELGVLTELQRLALSYNWLEGPIPSEIANLGALQYLELQTNRLAGPIPKELGALSELKELVLFKNSFTGTIPPELAGLDALQKLNISWNNLGGNIPAWLGQLSGLQALFLNKNNLRGFIPRELGDLTQLQHLGLHANYLSGPIPQELGNLSALQYLELQENRLSGPIPTALGALSELKELWLKFNHLSGQIPPELSNLSALECLEASSNNLEGNIPKELANLRNMKSLHLHADLRFTPHHPPFTKSYYPNINTLKGPLPPVAYGADMRDWALTPTDEEILRVRAALAKDAGKTLPRIVRWLSFITDAWHVVVPVIDDVTDVLLLTSTADFASPFWWICLVALVVADIERLWLLLTLCLTITMLPFLCWCDLFYSCRTTARVFARLNCRVDAPTATFRGRLKDSFLWVVVGSRSRCSPFWRTIGMSLDTKVEEAHRTGLGFGAIDKWVARHPFSFLGDVMFGKDFALKGGNDGVSRRARVMIRAVGETVVVDSLFLALSVVSEGWDGTLTGVAGISALFSVLELLTELQYYVAEAGAMLEPVRSSESSEESAISDASRTDLGALSNL